MLYFRQVQSTEFDFDDDDIGTTPKVTPQRLPGMLKLSTGYIYHNPMKYTIKSNLSLYEYLKFVDTCLYDSFI